MKILFVGPGRSGKDEACIHLSKVTGLKNAGTTSKYLAKYVAEKLGMDEEECYNRRRESPDMRDLWYNIGNEVRKKDPAILVREMWENGDIGGGIRDIHEVLAVREEGLADLIVWINRCGIGHDATMRFTSAEADIVIENHWSLDLYYRRLDRLAKILGIYKGEKN